MIRDDFWPIMTIGAATFRLYDVSLNDICTKYINREQRLHTYKINQLINPRQLGSQLFITLTFTYS